MAKRRTSHKDVEFEITSGSLLFREKSVDKALARAANLAISSGQSRMDTLVWSKAGAKWLYGDHGVEMYKEDPEASVFERIEFSANVQGRIA